LYIARHRRHATSAEFTNRSVLVLSRTTPGQRPWIIEVIQYLAKLLTTLATPLTLGIIILTLSAISLRRTQRAWLCASALFTAILLLFCGSDLGSRLLLLSLEHPYQGATIRDAPIMDAIVVLGGYLRVESRTGRPVEIGGAADRLLCASELYRAGKAPLIVLSGGNLSFGSVPSPEVPEATLASHLLEEWGIPETAILIEAQSRNTSQNARFSDRLLASRGIKKILLVTSAYHMRRAGNAFRRTGLTVTPFAADFLAGAEPGNLLLALLPDASALSNSGIAMKEWGGIALAVLQHPTT
jgi:uncharacterized SAM-binding protein YcdF (DUF218 family)